MRQDDAHAHFTTVDLVDQHSDDLFAQPWHLAPLNLFAPTTPIRLVHIVGSTAMDLSY